MNDNQAHYLRTVEKRIRWSDFGMNLRSVGQVSAWTVALLAGAAVPFVQVFDTTPRWLPALLGLIVVAAQGIDRLFARRSRGSAAMDRMRRALSKERRLFLSQAGEYATADDPFERFVTRVEATLDLYDTESVDAILMEQQAVAASGPSA